MRAPYLLPTLLIALCATSSWAQTQRPDAAKAAPPEGPSNSVAPLTPSRLYARIDGPVRMNASAEANKAAAADAIDLFEADGVTLIASAPMPTGAFDLAAVFPSFWRMDPPALRYVQARKGERPVGAPIVVEPLLTRPAFVDGWSAQILAAFDRRDNEALRLLMGLGDGARQGLRSAAESRTAASNPVVWSGVRAYVDHRVVLKTSAGDITLELRPDAAPATAHRFLTLVRDGFYDGTGFHRVIAQDALGRPYLVQAGDPTNTGAGGAGERIAFEPSTLPHDFGVVSMARHPSDPNSASGQFFICLSRDACAELDGRYTSFARVVDGHELVRTIAAAPTTSARPGDPRAPADRPIELVVIERALAVPAPPIARAAAPVIEQGPDEVER